MLAYAVCGLPNGKQRRRTGTAKTRKEAEVLRTRLLGEIDRRR